MQLGGADLAPWGALRSWACQRACSRRREHVTRVAQGFNLQGAMPTARRGHAGVSTRVWACFFAVLWSSPLFAVEPRLQPRTGASHPAKFTTVTDEGRVVFASPGDKAQPMSLTADEFIAWGAPQELSAGRVVVLVDGSLIVQRVSRTAPSKLMIEGERLIVEPSAVGPLSIPLEHVRGVIWHLPSDQSQSDRRLRELLSPLQGDTSAAKMDRIWLENGDQLQGTIDSLGDTEASLKTDVTTVKIERAKISALALNPSLAATAPRPKTSWLVGLEGGSLVVASRLTVSSQGLHFTPVLAGTTATWICPLAQVVFLQPFTPGIVYLSDIPVGDYRHVPYLSIEWPYQLDRNVTGGRLRAGGRLFAKGIGLHSTSRLSYTLDKPYERFEASLAIDDQTQGKGSVTFRVFVDGEQRFASEIVRGGQPPTPISVDLRGGGQVSLIVDFADGGDVLDRANWLDARLLPK